MNAFDKNTVQLLRQANGYKFGEKYYLLQVARDAEETKLRRTAAKFILVMDGIQKDGGPGSGNWGHRGRQGKRGGSGKGGGTHYRGGRSDVGFYGSKKDWINGLSGEKQHQAEKLLKQTPGSKKSVEQAEKQIMGGKTSGSQNEARKDKTQYLRLKGQARLLNDVQKREKLIDQNLSEEDKKVLSYFDGMYGIQTKQNDYEKMLNDGSMPKDQFDYYLDLKSRMMAGPDSGKEIPNAVKKFIGKNDSPAQTENKPEPKPQPGVRKQENWIQKNLDNVNVKYSTAMGSFKRLGLDYNGVDEETFAMNQDMVIASGIYRIQGRKLQSLSKSDAGNYLDAKGKIMGWKEMVSSGNIPNLTKEESIFVQSIQKDIDDHPYRFDGKINNNQRFLLLKAKALGSSVQSIDMAKKQLEKQKEKTLSDGRQNLKKPCFQQTTVSDQAKKSIEKIKSMNTLDQVTKYLKESGVSRASAKIDLQKMDVSIAKNAAIAYTTVVDKFPFMKGKFGDIFTGKPDSLGQEACCWPGSGDIRFAFGFAKEEQASMKTNIRSGLSGHNPTTDYRSVAYHEMGHAIDGYLTRKLQLVGMKNSWQPKDVSAYLRPIVAKECGIKVYQIGKHLSGYATTNAHQFLAECFSDYMVSEKPKKVSVQCMKQLKILLKSKGVSYND